MRLAKVLRELLTRAMPRQALAASEACTPTDAPWTLPFGLPSSSCLRPGSRSTSRLAAIDIASPTASGENPSASAWADAAGTINYEIVTRVSPRVPRVHLHAAEDPAGAAEPAAEEQA